jgi:predicted nucleic acid-binding protein
MRIVLDTDGIIDFAHGKGKWLERLMAENKQKTELIVPTVVIAEYWSDMYMDEEEINNVSENIFRHFIKQPLTEDIAKKVGELLRHKKYVLGAGFVDLAVAATAIQLKAKLATRNKKHYAKIPGLEFFEES